MKLRVRKVLAFALLIVMLLQTSAYASDLPLEDDAIVEESEAYEVFEDEHVHSFGFAGFTWTESDGGYTASASYICSCAETITVNAAVTSETVPATESEAGKIVYTAYVSETETKEQTAEDHTHSFEFTGFVWTELEEGGYAAEAEFVCSCGETQTVKAAVTEEIIPATETEDEKTVYTAYITEEESLDGQAHKEPMPDMKLRDAKAMALPTILSVVPSDINGIPAQIDVFKRTSGSSSNPTVTYELYLPGNVVPDNCYFSWEGGLQATVNGDTYDSGECPVPSPGQTASYAFSYNNRNATFRVTTYQGSPNVAPIFIVIDESLGTIAAMDGDIDHNAECQGIIFIDGTQHVLSKMKGRGNATWTGSDDKKPYNLTLGNKTNILGIDSAKTKKWSILAEITDHSLLCNRSGFMLAHQLGVGQDTASADVWMNGEYQGCYTVTPKYDSFVNKNGFLIEEDNYLEDPVASGGDPQFTLNGLKEASGWS